MAFAGFSLILLVDRIAFDIDQPSEHSTDIPLEPIHSPRIDPVIAPAIEIVAFDESPMALPGPPRDDNILHRMRRSISPGRVEQQQKTGELLSDTLQDYLSKQERFTVKMSSAIKKRKGSPR